MRNADNTAKQVFDMSVGQVAVSLVYDAPYYDSRVIPENPYAVNPCIADVLGSGLSRPGSALLDKRTNALYPVLWSKQSPPEEIGRAHV